MAKRLQFRRVVLLLVMLGAAFAGLGYRLVDLQVARHEELSAKAEQANHRIVVRPPRRGDILDRTGHPLATSTFVKTVCADPALIGNRQVDVARAIGSLLQMSEADLVQKLTLRVRQNAKGQTLTNHYVVLKNRVKPEDWEKIHAVMTNLTFGINEKILPRAQRSFYQDLRKSAVFVDPVDDQLRDYPNGTLAAHVVGCVGVTNLVVSGQSIRDTKGWDGTEKIYDSVLAGSRGWKLIETDRMGHEVASLRTEDVAPRDGNNVVLTIDSFIQQCLESALAEGMQQHSPVSVCGLVIRPRTGEILAMATLPTFDPNHVENASLDARRNRVISDIAEPGSTYKIVVASGALNDGIVRLSEVFDCEHGHFSYAGKVLHDHEAYDLLTVEEILMKSSNIGAAKIGIKLGARRLYDYIKGYGFGQVTGVPLPGEVSAKPFVPPVEKWSSLSIARIPMGQGISVTRIQMAMTMCAIANNGLLMRPKLVDRLEDSEHKTIVRMPEQSVRQVISESAAKQMVQALKMVVSPKGTAPKAALTHYVAAGKTGTAEKVENGVYVKKYFSSFIGFFPADKPELCIGIWFDDPKDNGYYGGAVAGPLFKQVAEKAATYLGIPEDMPSQPAGTNNIAGPAMGSRVVRTVASRNH